MALFRVWLLRGTAPGNHAEIAGQKLYSTDRAQAFVVNGNWTTDDTAPQEDDGSPAHNVNNVLTPDQLSKSENKMSSSMMSGVTAQSTTAQLAGQVPKESARDTPNESSKEEIGTKEPSSSDLPGTFPETPANEPSKFSVNPIPASSGYGNPVDLQPGEKVPDPSTLTSNTVESTVRDDPSLSKSGESENTFGVAPLPATGGFGNPINLQPGEKVPDPSTLTSNTVKSTVKDDPSLLRSEESEKTFGVAPLPATGGFGNPINLQPGEKVPHPSTFTSNTTNTHVTTDKESYERGSTAPQLPDVVTPKKERDNKGASMFSVPGITNSMIPESSLPMGGSTSAEKDPGAFIQSAGADTSTAALAGNVPKEPSGLPQVVQESQHEAGTDGGVGDNRQMVREKSDMEKELESKIPEAPATSEGIAGRETGTTSATSGGLPSQDIGTASTSEKVAGQGIGSGAAAGGISPGSHALPASIQQSINEINKGSAIDPSVPDIVQKSITQAHFSPEAAGDKTMVDEKSAVEQELLNKVPTENGLGEPASISSAALTGSAPAPTSSDTVTPAPASGQNPATTTTTSEESTPLVSSTNEATTKARTSAETPSVPTEPSANAATATVPTKGAKSFQTKPSAPPPAISEPAPTSGAGMTTAAAPATTPATEKAVRKSSDYSRDVSPMTKTDNQSQPMVTTGVGSSTAPQTSQPTSSTAAATPSSTTSAPTDKKSKRASGFFGKLKAKFSDKK
ncbi:MAG: hypothetical protein Q9182_005199 [Xanthomendoza sp. 2 TL-2023]